jgi:heme A synthase
MDVQSRPTAFSRYCWLVLAYNLVVIIWGVFLRASHSGDGCGQHWLTCNGEVVPSAPQLKTVIEYSHRVSTAVAGLVVLVLVIWVFRKFGMRSAATKAAFLALVFIIIEALIGRGLVLTGNTAGNWTPSRPYWTIGHLINTFLLLAALTATAWYSSPNRHIGLPQKRLAIVLLGLAALLILIVGSSGSLAALSNMFFPTDSIVQGLASDFDESSPMLVRLRISHPVLSIAVGVFLIFLSGWIARLRPESIGVARWSRALGALVLIQFASGAATLLLHAPIVMQLVHLLVADSMWIALMLMSLELMNASEAAGPLPAAMRMAA